MNAIVQYFQGSIEELRHVTWPTQQQALRLTGITVAFIIVTAAFFGLVDGLITEAIRLTIR
jgi:preprotein translocase SecE subunit